jgi:hypothetical protein
MGGDDLISRMAPTALRALDTTDRTGEVDANGDGPAVALRARTSPGISEWTATTLRGACQSGSGLHIGCERDRGL